MKTREEAMQALTDRYPEILDRDGVDIEGASAEAIMNTLYMEDARVSASEAMDKARATPVAA